MEPVTTIFLLKMIEAALGGFIFATVMMLTILYLDQVINWFRDRTVLKHSDINNLAFSLNTENSAGEYSTVYGIYNTREDKVVDAESVRSKNLDSNIKSLHSNNTLVIYE